MIHFHSNAHIISPTHAHIYLDVATAVSTQLATSSNSNSIKEEAKQMIAA